MKINTKNDPEEDPEKLSEIFNDFFVEKPSILAKKIKKSPNSDPLKKLGEKMKNSSLKFDLQEVNEMDVLKILKKLEP